MSNIMNDLRTFGLNPFAVQLLAESVLKSPLAPMTVGKPQGFFMPITRSDCQGWAGVRITVEAVPVEGAAQAAQERPAAWFLLGDGVYQQVAREHAGSIGTIPLYTHPAPAVDVDAMKRAGEAAARAMSLLTPPGICADAHHAKSDRHGIGERCPVADRYIAAYHALRAALEGLK